MGTASGPEKLENFNPLTLFSARNFIEFRHCESVKTDLLLSITIDSYRLVSNVRLRTVNVMQWCEVRRSSFFIYQMTKGIYVFI